MEQARKRLVELLLEADYVTSKDPTLDWWIKDVTVGVISKNYPKYKYLYCINENHDGKNGVFHIDYKSIWSIFSNENNMSYQQAKDFTESTLGEHYNFGDITTDFSKWGIYLPLGESYNFGDITTTGLGIWI